MSQPKWLPLTEFEKALLQGQVKVNFPVLKAEKAPKSREGEEQLK
jgi:hypothetical protein